MIPTANWHTRVVTYPLPISGDYSINAIDFRNDMRILEASEEGIGHPPIMAQSQGNYIAEGLGPVAITVQMINGYVLQFEEGAYSVVLTGGNIVTLVVNNSVNVTRVLSQAYVNVSLPEITMMAAVLDAVKVDTSSTDAIMKGDQIPTLTDFQILDKDSKTVLVDKDVTLIDGLAHLTEKP